MATILGYIFSLIGLLGAVAVIVRKVVRPVTYIGWPSMMVCICFFSGLILLFMGLIGEYVGRIFLGISNNPQFVVRQIDEHGRPPFLMNQEGKRFEQAEETEEDAGGERPGSVREQEEKERN